MSNLLDNICKLRDILEYKDYKKLPYIRNLSKAIFDGIHLNIKRKATDYKYELDFTSQDLKRNGKGNK